MKLFNPWQNFPAQWRRGNALVLVSAMLVLLVLIATAFLARTQSQRATASAMQDASGDDRRVDSIKKQLASEIAMHLFVKPIDPTGAANYIGGDSAGNRIPPGMYSVRYGVEPASVNGDRLSNVVDPSLNQASSPFVISSDNFPDGYNFAPYSVIPWTNWPDFYPLPTSNSRFVLEGEGNGNPLGNPGFGDTRWLRSTEPVRMDLDEVPNPNGDRFSHWPHLSWLPTPANGYRVVKDIADIEGNVLTGDMSQDINDAFGTPYEQWLPDVVPTPIVGAGTDPLDDNKTWSKAFVERRNAWFTRTQYQTTMLTLTASQMLPNFIKLDDPMGIGRTLNPKAKGVPKSDEWVFGNSPDDPGTPRNIVSRTFCDTDGDGFTDSFWFLAPVGKERNVRTVIGVSVIDNSAMVDLNVATRADRRTTVGFTPADLALVTSEPERSRSDVINSSVIGQATDTLVGLFDNPFNRIDSDFVGQETHKPIIDDIDAMASPSKFRVQFDPYRWAGLPTYYEPLQNGQKVGRTDPGQPTFLQALGLRSTQETWNDYFYGRPASTGVITPVTTEPFSGDMFDIYGPTGPARPDQEDPQYRFSSTAANNFRAALPNQPFVRPSERLRWFRSAATGQGTFFAEALNVPTTGTAFEQAPAGDFFGYPVPTRRFDASDELELRAYAGNNDPNSLSRLERSLNADDNVRSLTYAIPDTILRSTVLRGEAGGGQDQLTSPQLVKDLRRKVTVVSGQRNEIMPPWLWIGRPYGITNFGNNGTNPGNNETFQNGMLWLDPHPDSPGARDKNGDGRIDMTESNAGLTDLSRITCSNDPFADGKLMEFDKFIDGRDLNRALRYFEEMNAKLDLRKPLLVTEIDGNGIPIRTSDGSLDQSMAISVGEQQRAMEDFVREARGRLRMALRTHSPMGTGGSKQTNALTDNYAQYTDRFYEHFLFTMNAQVQPKNPFFTVFSPNTVGTKSSAKSLGQNGGVNFIIANPILSFRSAWSTEALTASMAANIATWRSRADLMFAPDASSGSPVTNLPLRAIHQPILPNATAPYNQVPTSTGILGVASALRATDPSKETPPLITKALTGSAAQADIVFPGIEKHPFFTEVFFGWVYPATTVDDWRWDPTDPTKKILTNKIELAKFDMCVTTPVTLGTIENYKYVALVNGKIGVANADGNGDTKRDKLDKIRTPVLVVQVANPWNEPIRLGDFRINIFGTDYDFPDYELDSSGTLIIDSNNQPVPLMLAPGTETEPATATVYLIANTIGNPTDAVSDSSSGLSPQDDLANVAKWDPWFRRRWLDYFDLFEFHNSPAVPSANPLVPEPRATSSGSPNNSPLFAFTERDKMPGQADPLSRSKLLNAMASSPGKAPAISLSTFKKSLTRNNMARGVTLQRVLKDPATGSGTGIFLEVDRFDGHSELDHWTNTGTNPILGSPMFADDRNFDTNLVTGGRFWTAAACITLPPTTGTAGNLGVGGLATNLPVLLGSVPDSLPGGAVASDYSYDGPGASASLFPPPTAVELVRTSAVKFRYLPVLPGKSECGVTAGATAIPPESTDAPPLFPGIVLGKVINSDKKADGDYFTTWTHVSRNWSRLFDAKFVMVPSYGAPGSAATYIPNAKLSTNAQTNLPVWNYTRQLVAGSFASNPNPTTSTVSRSPLIPVQRRAPRFVFSNRTEPEFTNRPQLLQPTRIELSGLIIDPSSTSATANGGKVISGSQVTLTMTPWCLNGSLQFDASFTSKGDIFRLGNISDPLDPDIWDPTDGTGTLSLNTDWILRSDPTKPTFEMLLTPVWAPLPDFAGLLPLNDNQDTTVDQLNWPALVLRKPTSFNCQTVFVHAGPNEQLDKDNPVLQLLNNEKVIAYYGNSTKSSLPDPSGNKNTTFNIPLSAAPPGSGSNIPPDAGYRVYMADKGARLLDHDGFLLPIDLVTGGQVVANPSATPPILARPWLARGLWNTLDRVPQAESLQMLQKDDDFEQIGELLDVFAWGPAYRIDSTSKVLSETTVVPTLSPTRLATPDTVSPVAGVRRAVIPNAQAKATFAEIMSNRVPGFPVGEGPFINRIQVDPLNVAFTGPTSSSPNLPYQFGGTSALRTPYAPNVPWGMRIFDCFTVDGAGAALRFDWTDPDNKTNIELGGSTSLNMIADRAILVEDQNGDPIRPVGALVPVDVRSTINTSSTTTVTPQILAQWEYDRSPSLSGNFAGLPTKGLLNINTATLEVMRTLPHMTQMVYDDTGRFDGDLTNKKIADQIPWPGTFTEYDTPKNNLGDNPAVLLPEALDIYRNQLDPSGWIPDLTNPMSPKTIASGETGSSYPTFVDRGMFVLAASKIDPLLPLTNVAYNTGMQTQRGFTSVGEITGIARQTNVDRTSISSQSGWLLPTAISSQRLWSVRLAGKDPHEWYASGSDWKKSTKYRWDVREFDATNTNLDPLDARLSTDRQGVRQFDFITGTAIADRQVLTYDTSYGDSEELNLLFKGISNLVTTRSDVFTVYFKVRTVKQNPIDGKWNGTDRETVLDDARYVMCVDRTNVNRPSDQPRIVYFSRVPD